jgi:hypothetical protein
MGATTERGAEHFRDALRRAPYAEALVVLFRALLAAQNDQSQEQDCEYSANDANHRAIHRVSPFRRNNLRYMLFIIGSSCRMMRMTTGPTVTTNKEGRIQKKIGNTSFTPSLAAFSSAICRA